MDQPVEKPKIHILVDRCVLCRMCQVSCPEKVITVDKQSRTWSIHHQGCTLCGMCLDVCPKEALYLMLGSETCEVLSIPKPKRTKGMARSNHKISQ